MASWFRMSSKAQINKIALSYFRSSAVGLMELSGGNTEQWYGRQSFVSVVSLFGMQDVRILQEPLQFYQKFWRTAGIDVACTSKLVRSSPWMEICTDFLPCTQLETHWNPLFIFLLRNECKRAGQIQIILCACVYYCKGQCHLSVKLKRYVVPHIHFELAMCWFGCYWPAEGHGLLYRCFWTISSFESEHLYVHVCMLWRRRQYCYDR